MFLKIIKKVLWVLYELYHNFIIYNNFFILKWYGSRNKIKYNFQKNSKIYFKNKIKNNSLIINKNFNQKFITINLFIPFNWNFIIIQKNFLPNYIYFYIYNLTYFFILPIVKTSLFLKYDYQTNNLNFKFLFNNNFYSLFIKFFKIIFYSFSKLFFTKIKFKGKGYYIYKNLRNTIALQFGYSHLYYIYSFFITVKFLSKTSILIFGINFNDLNLISYKLYNIKPINIFTGKGIRFSRQIIYRKTGKISSYR